MTPGEGSIVELHSRQSTVVVTAKDQATTVLSMTSLPNPEIRYLHARVDLLEGLLQLAFFLIFLAFILLYFAWNEAADKSGEGTMTGVLPRKYNAAHAPVMSHPVQSQLHHNVVEALRTGKYKAFASLLDNVTESVVRQGVTIFAPTDEALSDFLVKNTADELEPEDLVRFHIVTGIMPYSTLLRLKVGSILTTDVSNVTIQVTNATAGSYQVDDAVIVEPDMYTAATIAVHGINGVFNTTKIVEPSPEVYIPYIPYIPFYSSAFKATNVAVKSIPVFPFLMSFTVLFLIYLTADI